MFLPVVQQKPSCQVIPKEYHKASNKLQSNALKFIMTKDSLEGGFKSIKNKNPTNGK